MLGHVDLDSLVIKMEAPECSKTSVTTVKPQFRFCGNHLKWQKSGNYCSYGHLSGTIQKVCKIMKNVNCGNIKLGVYCTDQLIQHNMPGD